MRSALRTCASRRIRFGCAPSRAGQIGCGWSRACAILLSSAMVLVSAPQHALARSHSPSSRPTELESSLARSRLWREVELSDHEAIIALKASSADHGIRDGRVILEREQLLQARQAVLDVPDVALIVSHPQLPVVLARIGTRDALAAILALPTVDFVKSRAAGTWEIVRGSGGEALVGLKNP